MPEILPGHPVSDVDTYRLAVRAGFNPDQALVATAISLAEDPNRLPETRSPPNKNGTIDLGLWQINSIHWPNFGGPELLSHAFNNAAAAFKIFTDRQAATGNGFSAWTTFTGGQYRQYLGRAQIAQAEFQQSGGGETSISSLIQDLSQRSATGQTKLEQQGIDLSATTAPQIQIPNPIEAVATAIGGGFSQLGTSIHDAVDAAVLTVLHSLLGLLFVAIVLLGLYLLLAN